MSSCGLRSQETKMHQDAADAEILLANQTLQSPLSLTSSQRALVANGIKGVVTHGNQSIQWWRQLLDLPASI
jgi:hypothetical protein